MAAGSRGIPLGAARYDEIGVGYARRRREEPAWTGAIHAAIGAGSRVLNVGAGSGSYEPRAGAVVGVEPSVTMLAQRGDDAAPAVRALAEALPFRAASFDVALAVLTVHHWADAPSGLAELRRVASRQVVVTWDPDVSRRFWLHRDYLPQLADLESSQASLGAVVRALHVTRVEALEVPRGCADGFLGSHWEDPAMYLDESVRAASSGLSLLDPVVVDAAMAALDRDIADGSWARRNAELDGLASLDTGFRLVVAGH